MAQKITFNFDNTKFMAADAEIEAIKPRIEAAKKTLVEKTGEGNDFLGWIDLPVNYDKEEFDRIKKAAAKIQADSDVLLVIGIGGGLLQFKIGSDFTFSLGGVALDTVIGIILNLVIPRDKASA